MDNQNIRTEIIIRTRAEITGRAFLFILLVTLITFHRGTGFVPAAGHGKKKFPITDFCRW